MESWRDRSSPYNEHMVRIIITLVIALSIVPPSLSSAKVDCDSFQFTEDADRAGLECDLPIVTETGIVRPDPTGRRGRVSHIVDGDTLHATFGATTEKIRLFAVNTPELNPIECYGIEATALLAQLAPIGSIVWFERGEVQLDRYGRSLYWAWIEVEPGRWQLLQDAIVAAGAGEVRIYPPDDRYADWLMVRESQAKTAGAGMWTTCAEPTPAASMGIASSSCDPAYPTVCIRPVKPGGDLDCAEIPDRRFQVLPPDPHNFDGDGNGIGCERVG
jgi:micrococcal nuclease